nr:uncharacterized protein c31g5.21 [Quercus suber]
MPATSAHPLAATLHLQGQLLLPTFDEDGAYRHSSQMPSSDYANTVGGGLKLKGVKDAGVTKHKKKRKDKSLALVKRTDADKSTSLAQDEPGERRGREEVTMPGTDQDPVRRREDSAGRQFGKTEAQRRHEERRRKMLEAKFEKEGTKTHKERVEELNKYLSGLSEHHDMPRIGPG